MPAAPLKKSLQEIRKKNEHFRNYLSTYIKQQIRNTWKVLKWGVGGGWKRPVGLII